MFILTSGIRILIVFLIVLDFIVDFRLNLGFPLKQF